MENPALFNTLIYLSSAVIMVPIAKRLGLGSVLGYLLAGIAIGPWGLNLVNELDRMLHFSEFGVVLLLFLIGLELEPKRLWALRRSIFVWGGLQVGCVALALGVIAVAFGIDWKVTLVSALALSLSSTAIALATMGERNIMKTPAGSTGFSILLFQDIAAIPMIALIPLLGFAGIADHTSIGLELLKIAAVIASLIIGGRYLVHPILRAIAKLDLREIFTAFALLLIVSIAWLMKSVGMSMALGTFLAGVLLADSEYRHALESDLEPFKGLLLGLFFVVVGMLVDFSILLQRPLLVMSLVLGFLLIKGGVLYGLSKFFGIARQQQVLFALLLAQGGEFAFVIFQTAATARVLAPQTAALLIVVVALSMALTPLLLFVYDKLIAVHLQPSAAPPHDTIENQDSPVIIAGFGRFGQIIGRLLHVNRIRMTVLDHDPDQVALLRRFGFQVFYGDARRLDLLHAAGAAKARALVVAIDNVEDSLALIDAVQQTFPHLAILARARNVRHYYQLMDRGITVLERETFESALHMGRKVLQHLGYGAYQARQAAMKFRAHNIKTLHAVYPHYKDQQQVISLSKQARSELEEMFARDFASLNRKSVDRQDER